MIIKEADNKDTAIKSLRSLLSLPDCTVSTRTRIEQEIRRIHAGFKGESEAAYEMKVHWGESKNWMIIHDLRIEHGGLVAQIDHLIINRFLEFWVCESKNFGGGISINDHGEFTAFFGEKPYGVASPIEQNNRHILILKRFFDDDAIKLPTRLGFTIKPELKSLVLVSKHSRITRPKAEIDGLDCVIKNDQLFKLIDRFVKEYNNPMTLVKIIGQDTLETLARDIAAQHKPIVYDWAAHFGLSLQSKPAISTPAEAAATPEPGTGEARKSKQKLVCNSCGASIAYNVAKFCWFNKAKFGGHAYCMDCQKKVAAA